MEVSPETGLRAWVEYLRDMGVYDLYRRETPSLVLPEEVVTRLRAATSAAPPLATGSTPVKMVGSRPADRRERPSAGPAGAPAAGPAGRLPLSPGATPASGSALGPRPTMAPVSPVLPAKAGPEPVRNYFPTEAEVQHVLSPELQPPMPKPSPLEALSPPPANAVPPQGRAAALVQLRAEIGDCTRCPLAYAGRHTIVFGEGDPNAQLMFVGEGPGADEDASGQPFIGKAGQLLNNMIVAMGLQREQVYIANIVKCRPPGNRTPEFAEATTCSQFLLAQIDIVRPEVIVALGSTAATYILGVRQPLSALRGQWLASRGAKVAVTYHPAFLLRDPRQKAEAWKDLQRVMAELGLNPPAIPRKG